MPESKSDRAQQLNQEVVNFVECGDARGPSWLQTHPQDQMRAHDFLEGANDREAQRRSDSQ
jgi:hypothetical protein